MAVNTHHWMGMPANQPKHQNVEECSDNERRPNTNCSNQSHNWEHCTYLKNPNTYLSLTFIHERNGKEGTKKFVDKIKHHKNSWKQFELKSYFFHSKNLC